MVAGGGTEDLSYEVVSQLERVQSANPVPVTVSFSKSFPLCFLVGNTSDNVGNNDLYVNSEDGNNRYKIATQRSSGQVYITHGLVKPLSTNLTAYFPYSDGGAYYNFLACVGMNKLPKEYCIRTLIGSERTITLDKIYEHLVIICSASGSANISLEMNNIDLSLIQESSLYGRYTYHVTKEIHNNSDLEIEFVYSTNPSDSCIVIFAYNV